MIALSRGRSTPAIRAICVLRFLRQLLALSLLVLGIDANHAHHAFALDDLALVAHFFNACSNFHPFLRSDSSLEQGSAWLRPIGVPKGMRLTQAEIIPLCSLALVGLRPGKVCRSLKPLGDRKYLSLLRALLRSSSRIYCAAGVT
jgi:hypothetical protein